MFSIVETTSVSEGIGFVAYVAMAWFAGMLANARARSFPGWCVLGLLIGPIALLVWFLPEETAAGVAPATPGSRIALAIILLGCALPIIGVVVAIAVMTLGTLQ